MPAKKEKDIVVKPKVLANTGYLLTADGQQFIIAAEYKFKAPSFGEVAEWEGTVTTIAELPMNVEYVLSLEQEEDDRAGRIRLESVNIMRKGKVTAYEYTFKGVSPLT
jgi:hypothetical protein